MSKGSKGDNEELNSACDFQLQVKGTFCSQPSLQDRMVASTVVLGNTVWIECPSWGCNPCHIHSLAINELSCERFIISRFTPTPRRRSSLDKQDLKTHKCLTSLYRPLCFYSPSTKFKQVPSQPEGHIVTQGSKPDRWTPSLRSSQGRSLVFLRHSRMRLACVLVNHLKGHQGTVSFDLQL